MEERESKKKLIIDTIRLIVATKMMNRQDPKIATLSELEKETGYGHDFILEICRDLYRDGLIDGGKTMQDSYFIPKKRNDV